MELKIDLETPAFSRNIDKQLGVSEKRLNSLFKKMESIFNELLTEGNLGAAYKKVSSVCDTIEEYTMCMHVFIFRCARTGHLRSEVESN